MTPPSADQFFHMALPEGAAFIRIAPPLKNEVQPGLLNLDTFEHRHFKEFFFNKSHFKRMKGHFLIS